MNYYFLFILLLFSSTQTCYPITVKQQQMSRNVSVTFLNDRIETPPMTPRIVTPFSDFTFGSRRQSETSVEDLSNTMRRRSVAEVVDAIKGPRKKSHHDIHSLRMSLDHSVRRKSSVLLEAASRLERQDRRASSFSAELSPRSVARCELGGIFDLVCSKVREMTGDIQSIPLLQSWIRENIIPDIVGLIQKKGSTPPPAETVSILRKVQKEQFRKITSAEATITTLRSTVTQLETDLTKKTQQVLEVRRTIYQELLQYKLRGGVGSSGLADNGAFSLFDVFKVCIIIICSKDYLSHFSYFELQNNQLIGASNGEEIDVLRDIHESEKMIELREQEQQMAEREKILLADLLEKSNQVEEIREVLKSNRVRAREEAIDMKAQHKMQISIRESKIEVLNQENQRLAELEIENKNTEPVAEGGAPSEGSFAKPKKKMSKIRFSGMSTTSSIRKPIKERTNSMNSRPSLSRMASIVSTYSDDDELQSTLLKKKTHKLINPRRSSSKANLEVKKIRTRDVGSSPIQAPNRESQTAAVVQQPLEAYALLAGEVSAKSSDLDACQIRLNNEVRKCERLDTLLQECLKKIISLVKQENPSLNLSVESDSIIDVDTAMRELQITLPSPSPLNKQRKRDSTVSLFNSISSSSVATELEGLGLDDSMIKPKYPITTSDETTQTSPTNETTTSFIKNTNNNPSVKSHQQQSECHCVPYGCDKDSVMAFRLLSESNNLPPSGECIGFVVIIVCPIPEEREQQILRTIIQDACTAYGGWCLTDTPRHWSFSIATADPDKAAQLAVKVSTSFRYSILHTGVACGRGHPIVDNIQSNNVNFIYPSRLVMKATRLAEHAASNLIFCTPEVASVVQNQSLFIAGATASDPQIQLKVTSPPKYVLGDREMLSVQRITFNGCDNKADDSEQPDMGSTTALSDPSCGGLACSVVWFHAGSDFKLKSKDLLRQCHLIFRIMTNRYSGVELFSETRMGSFAVAFNSRAFALVYTIRCLNNVIRHLSQYDSEVASLEIAWTVGISEGSLFVNNKGLFYGDGCRSAYECATTASLNDVVATAEFSRLITPSELALAQSHLPAEDVISLLPVENYTRVCCASLSRRPILFNSCTKFPYLPTSPYKSLCEGPVPPCRMASAAVRHPVGVIFFDCSTFQKYLTETDTIQLWSMISILSSALCGYMSADNNGCVRGLIVLQNKEMLVKCAVRLQEAISRGVWSDRVVTYSRGLGLGIVGPNPSIQIIVVDDLPYRVLNKLKTISYDDQFTSWGYSNIRCYVSQIICFNELLSNELISRLSSPTCEELDVTRDYPNLFSGLSFNDSDSKWEFKKHGVNCCRLVPSKQMKLCNIDPQVLPFSFLNPTHNHFNNQNINKQQASYQSASWCRSHLQISATAPHVCMGTIKVPAADDVVELTIRNSSSIPGCSFICFSDEAPEISFVCAFESPEAGLEFAVSVTKNISKTLKKVQTLLGVSIKLALDSVNSVDYCTLNGSAEMLETVSAVLEYSVPIGIVATGRFMLQFNNNFPKTSNGSQISYKPCQKEHLQLFAIPPALLHTDKIHIVVSDVPTDQTRTPKKLNIPQSTSLTHCWWRRFFSLQTKSFGGSSCFYVSVTGPTLDNFAELQKTCGNCNGRLISRKDNVFSAVFTILEEVLVWVAYCKQHPLQNCLPASRWKLGIVEITSKDVVELQSGSQHWNGLLLSFSSLLLKASVITDGGILLDSRVTINTATFKNDLRECVSRFNNSILNIQNPDFCSLLKLPDAYLISLFRQPSSPQDITYLPMQKTVCFRPRKVNPPTGEVFFTVFRVAVSAEADVDHLVESNIAILWQAVLKALSLQKKQSAIVRWYGQHNLCICAFESLSEALSASLTVLEICITSVEWSSQLLLSSIGRPVCVSEIVGQTFSGCKGSSAIIHRGLPVTVSITRSTSCEYRMNSLGHLYYSSTTEIMDALSMSLLGEPGVILVTEACNVKLNGTLDKIEWFGSQHKLTSGFARQLEGVGKLHFVLPALYRSRLTSASVAQTPKFDISKIAAEIDLDQELNPPPSTKTIYVISVMGGQLQQLSAAEEHFGGTRIPLPSVSRLTKISSNFFISYFRDPGKALSFAEAMTEMQGNCKILSGIKIGFCCGKLCCEIHNKRIRPYGLTVATAVWMSEMAADGTTLGVSYVDKLPTSDKLAWVATEDCTVPIPLLKGAEIFIMSPHPDISLVGRSRRLHAITETVSEYYVRPVHPPPSGSSVLVFIGIPGCKSTWNLVAVMCLCQCYKCNGFLVSNHEHGVFVIFHSEAAMKSAEELISEKAKTILNHKENNMSVSYFWISLQQSNQIVIDNEGQISCTEYVLELLLKKIRVKHKKFSLCVPVSSNIIPYYSDRCVLAVDSPGIIDLAGESPKDAKITFELCNSLILYNLPLYQGLLLCGSASTMNWILVFANSGNALEFITKIHCLLMNEDWPKGVQSVWKVGQDWSGPRIRCSAVTSSSTTPLKAAVAVSTQLLRKCATGETLFVSNGEFKNSYVGAHGSYFATLSVFKFEGAETYQITPSLYHRRKYDATEPTIVESDWWEADILPKNHGGEHKYRLTVEFNFGSGEDIRNTTVTLITKIQNYYKLAFEYLHGMGFAVTSVSVGDLIGCSTFIELSLSQLDLPFSIAMTIEPISVDLSLRTPFGDIWCHTGAVTASVYCSSSNPLSVVFPSKNNNNPCDVETKQLPKGGHSVKPAGVQRDHNMEGRNQLDVKTEKESSQKSSDFPQAVSLMRLAAHTVSVLCSDDQLQHNEALIPFYERISHAEAVEYKNAFDRCDDKTHSPYHVKVFVSLIVLSVCDLVRQIRLGSDTGVDNTVGTPDLAKPKEVYNEVKKESLRFTSSISVKTSQRLSRAVSLIKNPMPSPEPCNKNESKDAVTVAGCENEEPQGKQLLDYNSDEVDSQLLKSTAFSNSVLQNNNISGENKHNASGKNKHNSQEKFTPLPCVDNVALATAGTQTDSKSTETSLTRSDLVSADDILEAESDHISDMNSQIVTEVTVADPSVDTQSESAPLFRLTPSGVPVETLNKKSVSDKTEEVICFPTAVSGQREYPTSHKWLGSESKRRPLTAGIARLNTAVTRFIRTPAVVSQPNDCGMVNTRIPPPTQPPPIDFRKYIESLHHDRRVMMYSPLPPSVRKALTTRDVS